MESNAIILPNPHSAMKPFDINSCRGKFGWFELGNVQFPYIFRTAEKTREQYVSVRMLENRLLTQLIRQLPTEVISCHQVLSFYMTEHESTLLNEINSFHADFFFGKERYTPKDVVLRLTDAREFYGFLDFCLRRIVLRQVTTPSRCGYLRIDGKNVITYSVIDNIRLIPLFYFEASLERVLRGKTKTIQGWDMAYLRFCCKDQEIRNEILSARSCQAITFEEMKSISPNTVYEEYWPMTGIFAANSQAQANWNLIPSVAGSNVTFRRGGAFQTSPSNVVTELAAPPRIPQPVPPPAAHLVVGSGYGVGSSPLPAIPASPSVPSATATPTVPSAANLVVNAATEATPTPSAAAAPQASMAIPANLIPLEEYPVDEGRPGPPYRLETAMLQQRRITCVNVRPYAYSELVMTFSDFVRIVCPGLPPESVLQILEKKLAIQLYQGNRGHQALLSSKSQENEPVPLLFVKDIAANLPRITSYIKEVRRSQSSS